MSGNPDNIVCFESAVAGVLAELYRQFPRPMFIVSADFEARLIDDGLLPEQCQWGDIKTPPGLTLVGSTINWLEEEKLVRCSSKAGNNHSKFNGLVLTAKGFAALNAPVLPATEGETYGAKLLKLGRHTAQVTVESTIQAFIQSLFPQQ